MITFSWVRLYKGFIYNVNKKGKYFIFPLAVFVFSDDALRAKKVQSFK